MLNYHQRYWFCYYNYGYFYYSDYQVNCRFYFGISDILWFFIFIRVHYYTLLWFIHCINVIHPQSINVILYINVIHSPSINVIHYINVTHPPSINVIHYINVIHPPSINAIHSRRIHYVKSVQILRFFWSVFSFIWTKYRKIWTKKTSVIGHFSHSDCSSNFKCLYGLITELLKIAILRDI